MPEPTYATARAVAGSVQAHFSSHLKIARDRGRTDLAPEPDIEVIETMIDAAFWAGDVITDGAGVCASAGAAAAVANVTTKRNSRRCKFIALLPCVASTAALS